MLRPPTILIVGCGLAGSAVAWAAHRRGWDITLVDKPAPDSCSRVAAGLVTPITGSRAASSWRWDEFYEFASDQYSHCERETGQSFWTEKPALRIFQSESERQRSIERWCGTEPHGEEASDDGQGRHCSPKMTLCEPSEIAGYVAPFGAAWMSPAARLDTQIYLDATLATMKCSHRVIEQEIALNEEVFSPAGEKIFVQELGTSFDSVVLCQGFASRFNTWFNNLPLHPARGDILTVRLDSESDYSQVVHASSWMVPLGNDSYLTGATYDRQTLDGIVDDRPAVVLARQEVQSRLGEYIAERELHKNKIQIIAHRAAVRPASYDRHPLMGEHKTMAHLYVLNGLGSKGTLMAPRLADMLCSTIESKAPIAPTLLWTRTKR